MKRRTFIQTLCLTGFCLKTLSSCNSTPTGFHAISKNKQLLVPQSAFTQSQTLNVVFQNDLIALVKLTEQNYAASLLNCTHMGCKLESNAEGFICPCHGARFNKEGKVTKGPATKNLTTFETSLNDEFIIIHTD